MCTFHLSLTFAISDLILVPLCYSPSLSPFSPQVGDGETVSWVKASLMAQRRTLKTKKSAVVAAVEEPHFNQPFHFRPPTALEGVHLSLTLSLAPNAASKGQYFDSLYL